MLGEGSLTLRAPDGGHQRHSGIQRVTRVFDTNKIQLHILFLLFSNSNENSNSLFVCICIVRINGDCPYSYALVNTISLSLLVQSFLCTSCV
ncbi:hypothetical protein FKM82_004718 [Ascaphus truei]